MIAKKEYVEQYLNNIIKQLNEHNIKTTEEQRRFVLDKYSSSDKSIEEIKKEIDELVQQFIENYRKRQQELLKRKQEEKEKQLNDLFNCRISNNTLHIHVVPESVKEDIIKAGGIKKYLDNVVTPNLDDALTKIVDILKDPQNQMVSNVFAVSPLLRLPQVQEIFSKRGFSTGINNNEIFKKMFDNAKIGDALISKEKLLSLYEKQDNKDITTLINYFDVQQMASYCVSQINSKYKLLSETYDLEQLKEEFNPKKGMYPLSTKLNRNQVIELGVDFFEKINPEFAKTFLTSITENNNIIRISDNPKVEANQDGTIHHIELTEFGDLRDLYTIAHEYSHVFDCANGINETRITMTETNAQCMERCLDTYLKSLPDEKLNKYGMDKAVLENDILSRNVATFFNRMNNINNLSKGDGNIIKDSGYMFAQIYSKHFEDLNFDEQKQSINNMITNTKNNNMPKLLSEMPCDITKKESIDYSVNKTIKEVDKLNKYNKQQELTNQKVKKLVKQDNNKGYINVIILSLLTGFTCGVVSILTYLLISK